MASEPGEVGGPDPRPAAHLSQGEALSPSRFRGRATAAITVGKVMMHRATAIWDGGAVALGITPREPPSRPWRVVCPVTCFSCTGRSRSSRTTQPSFRSPARCTSTRSGNRSWGNGRRHLLPGLTAGVGSRGRSNGWCRSLTVIITAFSSGCRKQSGMLLLVTFNHWGTGATPWWRYRFWASGMVATGTSRVGCSGCSSTTSRSWRNRRILTSRS